jgi:MFS family permease
MMPAQLGGRFAKLWAAGTTSALGSGLTLVAGPLLMAARTSNPLLVSGVSAVSWLPWLLFALPGGVLVDRVDRRRLMLVIDWVRVGAMGLLTVAVAAGHVVIPALYAVLFIINAGEVVFRSASQAMVPAVVPRDGLERANGWLQGGETLTGTMIAGPLGGFLFAVAVSLPFLANTATYAVSAVLIGLVAGRYRPEPSPAAAAAAAGRVRSLWAEVAEGFGWLIRQRLLRTMALLIGLLNVTLTAALAVLVLLARERLHLGSVGYGLLFTSMAVGSLLGAALGDRLIRWVTATWTIRIGLLVEAGTHLALAASASWLLVGIVLFAFGVHSSLWNIVGKSLQQRLTPPSMLGRVGSTSLFLAAGGNCVGALLGGAIATRFGVTAPYWVGFVVAVAVSALTWRVFSRDTVARAYAEPAPGPA